MIVDREQVRRDAAATLAGQSREGAWLPYEETWHSLATGCLALLAELEQAERDVESAIAASVEALGYSEARLAKVPALVEALRKIRDNTRAIDDGKPYNGEDDEIARDILAEWDAE